MGEICFALENIQSVKEWMRGVVDKMADVCDVAHVDFNVDETADYIPDSF